MQSKTLALSEADLLLQLANARIIEIVNGKENVVGTGKLQIFELLFDEQDEDGNIPLLQNMEKEVLVILVVPKVSTSVSTSKLEPEPFHMRLDANTQVFRQSESSYLLPATEGTIFKVDLISFTNEEHQIFQDILQHYTTFSLPSEHFKNTLALVNNRGEVIGKLSENVSFKETEDVRNLTGGDQTPVVLQLPEQLQDLLNKAKSADYTPVITVGLSTSTAMVKHSETIGRYMIDGATWIGEGIECASQSLKKQISPNAIPLKFSPETRNKVKTAKEISEVVAKASSLAGSAAMLIASNVGNAIAVKIKEKRSVNGVKGSQVLTITNNSLIALGTIFGAISDSTRIIFRSTASSALDLVQHKYGPEAGELASEVAGATENIYLVYFDAKGLRRRTVLQGVMKSTVVELQKK